MLKKIPFRLAVNITTALLLLVLIYHMLIITSIIPYEATWGGRLKSQQEMIRFESVSLLVNSFLLALVSVKAGRLKVRIPIRVITVLLWFFVGLFVLNTVGNLASTNFWEMVIFTPLTALSAVLFARMAVEKN